MLDNKLVRTRFSEGLKPHTSLWDKNDVYLENKFRILSLGGLGYGVLLGYENSLSLAVEGSHLVVKSGAAIDRYGNLIFIPKAVTIEDKISLGNFNNNQNTYVYIKHNEEKGGLEPHKDPSKGEIHTEYTSTYAIKITNYQHTESEWIELGRIVIDYNQADSDTLSNPLNSFFPRNNEIDLRYIPKILTNLTDLKEEDNERVYMILGKFADYLNEVSFKYHLFSSSTASSFVYQIREDIFTNTITPYDFYKKLKSAVDVVFRIKDENENIQGTDFWKNINRLRDLFSIGFGEAYNGKIDFYNFDIDDKAYFGRILVHFKMAGESSRDFDINVKEEIVQESEHKGYVQVGRSDDEKYDNDIVLSEDTSISRVHLVVTAYKGGFFIEDISKGGTFINAQKIEKGAKQFVKPSDEIILGRKGTKLNLNDPKIQDLLNL